MKRLFIVLISIPLFLLSTNILLEASQSTKQETHGKNSPIANTQKGDICITINECEGIRALLQETLEKCENAEVVELKMRLSEIHKIELKISAEEADKWADQFIESIPLRKERLIAQQEEEHTRFVKERKNFPIMFEYIINKFDAEILALKNKLDKNITLKQEDFNGIQIYDDASIKLKNPVSIATFANGVSLEVEIVPGKINNEQFLSYPTIVIYNVKKGNRVSIFGLPHQCPTLGSGFCYGDGELTEGLKNYIQENFNCMIYNAYSNSSK
jgi:hypothetical protein